MPAQLHPVAEGVVGDVIQAREVIGFDQFQETGDPLAAERVDVELIAVSVAVVLGLGVTEGRGDLVP